MTVTHKWRGCERCRSLTGQPGGDRLLNRRACTALGFRPAVLCEYLGQRRWPKSTRSRNETGTIQGKNNGCPRVRRNPAHPKFAVGRGPLLRLINRWPSGGIL